MALAGLRSIILSNVRLGVGNHAQQAIGGASSLSFLRGFAAEGTYLDKDQVTERVLHVVKHFDKVEGSKVRAFRKQHTTLPDAQLAEIRLLLYAFH